MMDAKTAAEAAKEHARAMLGQAQSRLEEIERDTYKGRDVWRVTLGFPPDKTLMGAVSPIRALGLGPLEYKVFLVDAEDGGLVAIKLREPAIQ
jgi:hypothetical protein